MFNFFRANEDNFYDELQKDELNFDKLKKYILKGIDLNKKDEKGKTILYSLAAKKKLDAIRYLLKFDLDINSEDNYAKTALDYAIDKSDGMLIEFFLENGASINRTNSSGRTALQDVALDANYKIFQIFMNHNPDFSIYENNEKNIIFDAVRGKSLKIVKDVVSNLENLNALNKDNQTALFEAVLYEDDQIAKYLIVQGINVNFLDKFGQNALFNALIMGDKNLSVIELLIDKGINLNIVDNENRTIVDEILDIVAMKSEPNKEGKYNYIHQDTDYLKIAKLLIKKGLEVNKTYDGKTALQVAVDQKNFSKIKFLIDSGADINLTDMDGKSILSHELFKGYSNYQMIDFLIENGADLDVKDLDERTVVDELVDYILVQGDYKRANESYKKSLDKDGRYDILLKKVLSYKPNIDIQRLDGRNVLFDLVLYNDFETLRQIINYGADLNIKDENGNTPLSYMIEKGIKFKDQKLRDDFMERLVFLLKFRVDVDVQDNDGRTVFHKAVIANDLPVVEKLLTKKANLSLKDKHGRTALHHTQWNGNYKIARWLISAGADMNIPDKSGFTLLNYAAILGHTKLVVTLIASGVLMYNHNPKNRKVAEFFKSKESNLQKLLDSNVSDGKMKRALQEVVENLKKEINEALGDE